MPINEGQQAPLRPRLASAWRGAKIMRDESTLLLSAALVGGIGAVSALGFQRATQGLRDLFLGGAGGSFLDVVAALPWWARLIVPAIGAAVAAAILHLLHRDLRAAGMPQVMEAVSLRKGAVGTKSVAIRALASMAIISSGGSVGREGPIILISASLAAVVASLFRFTRERWSLLVGCGVAAGMAAAYNAPIGASVFALELILGNFAMDVFAPVVVASVTSTFVQRLVLGVHPTYEVPEFGLASTWELPAFLALGLLCGAAGVFFRKSLEFSERMFKKLEVPPFLKLPIGGLVVGAIGIGWPYVWGNGYETVDLILHQRLGLSMIFLLLVLKIVATAVTVGSGGIGGVFTPTLFVGAAVGALLGGALAALLPGRVAPFGAYALVGMGGLVAGTTHAPIMAILMVSELTEGYGIVLPLMLCCIVSSLVARRIQSESIYSERLRKLGIDPGWGIEELALRYLQARDVMRMDVPVVGESSPFSRVLDLFHTSRSDTVYVLGPERTYAGAIDLHDVKQFLNDREMGSLVVAAELSVPRPVASPDDALATLMSRFVEGNVEEIPVVEEPERRFLGVVSRRDVILALNREVLKKQVMLAHFHPRGESATGPGPVEKTDFVELPEGYILDKFPVPARYRGKTLGEINLRAQFNLNVISVVSEEPDGRETRSFPSPMRRIGDHDFLIVVGRREDIARFYEPG